MWQRCPKLAQQDKCPINMAMVKAIRQMKNGANVDLCGIRVIASTNGEEALGAIHGVSEAMIFSKNGDGAALTEEAAKRA